MYTSKKKNDLVCELIELTIEDDWDIAETITLREEIGMEITEEELNQMNDESDSFDSDED